MNIDIITNKTDLPMGYNWQKKYMKNMIDFSEMVVYSYNNVVSAPYGDIKSVDCYCDCDSNDCDCNYYCDGN